jgi:hypothetical protein
MGDVTVDEEIAADPAVVYDLISDITRMGEWSPETTSCQWIDAGPAAVGKRFRGSNKHGWHTWSTTCTVTAAERGAAFAFDVQFLGRVPVAHWAYELSAVDGGCLASETWSDRRPGWLVKVSPVATGVRDRVEHNRASMRESLRRLRVAAESFKD